MTFGTATEPPAGQYHVLLTGGYTRRKPKQSNVMNETVPPISGNLSQPKTSGLAIWSLVLGILSLACLSIFSAIPGVICGHKALSKIKHSGGALAGQGLAIAGLVTGYLGILWAVIFIPMLLAIAIPNFVKARDEAMKNAGINNLRQIDAAKKEWALEKGKKTGDVPTAQDLTPYFKNGVFPTCPSGGTYTIGAIGDAPTCSIPRHSQGDDPTSLNVKMILYKPKDACALIGGKTVMAGDVLEGFKIIAIEKDSIIVQSPAGVKKELRLGDVLK
jgi:hypothetical protein